MSKLPWINSIYIKTVTLKQGRYGLLVFGTHFTYTQAECHFVESMRLSRHSWKKNKQKKAYPARRESRTERESWVRKRSFAYTALPLGGIGFQTQETQLPSNFWAISTPRKPLWSLPHAGSMGSRPSVGLPLHCPRLETGMVGSRVGTKHHREVHLNTKWVAAAGSPEETAGLSYRGKLLFSRRKGCPREYATSLSDQNQAGNKISSRPKGSYIFATWKCR